MPVTGKMPVPQVSPLKGQHYIYYLLPANRFKRVLFNRVIREPSI